MTALVRAAFALILAAMLLTLSPGRVMAQPAQRPAGEPTLVASTGDTGGTGWTPATPMAGAHAQRGPWAFMLHGDGVLQALTESGSSHYRSRGLSSVNWLMASVSRPLGRGRVSARAMVSGEPWTVPRCGYPDLLATGELCNGDSIHDRQHPHDLTMELAAQYDHPFVRSTRLQLYGGPAGEPALGPTAFLHRPSAAGNPVAPISHHWLDSSHVSFGVLTAALYTAQWKVDASAFNGREPDERRMNIEKGRLDSWSARFTLARSPRVVWQMSGGHLHEAEAGLGSLPRQDVNRITASMSCVHPWRAGGSVATTLAYGARWGLANVGVERLDQMTHALLVEASLATPGPHTWFARAELVGKTAHDLHADEFSPSIFTVGKLQLGYLRRLASVASLTAAVGVSGSAALLPPLLAPRYEGRVAPGAGVFLRISPAAASGAMPHDHAHDVVNSP